jgi:hypothetical protein
MHRSGTSAFARVASLLGCSLPRDLAAADKGNESGHWESNRVVELNVRLLASAGSSWDDWLPLNEGWNESGLRADYLAQAREVLLAEYETAPLFVLKDPRICRLAPFWIEAIESVGARPVIALPQRDPYEVSASLTARDASEPGLGLLLWLRHVLEAEVATRHLPRYFFSYDDLLADWSLVADGFERTTGIRFPRRSLSAEAEISGFLTDVARHQRRAPGPRKGVAAPHWLSETQAILNKWCREGENEGDRSRLDLIRNEFNQAAPSFSRFIASGTGRGSFGAGVDARQALETATAEHQQIRADLSLRLEAAEALAQALREQHDAEASERAAATELEAAEYRQSLADLGRRLEAAEALAQALREQHDAEASERAAATELEAAEYRQSLADLGRRLEAAEALAQAERERRETTAREHADADQRERAVHDEIRADLNRRLQDAEQRLILERDTAKRDRDEAGRQQAELNSALRQRHEEAAQAWAKANAEQHVREKVEAELARALEQNERLVESFAGIETRLRVDAEALAIAQTRADRADRALTLLRHDETEARAALAEREAELEKAQARASRADAELAQLAILYIETKARLDELGQQVGSTAERTGGEPPAALAELIERADKAEAAARQANEALAALKSEVVVLSGALAGEKSLVADTRVQASWLIAVMNLLQKRSRWRLLVSALTGNRHEKALLESNGLFDAAAYLKHNPDVARAGVDPLSHLLKHGLAEGRKWQ